MFLEKFPYRVKFYTKLIGHHGQLGDTGFLYSKTIWWGPQISILKSQISFSPPRHFERSGAPKSPTHNSTAVNRIYVASHTASLKSDRLMSPTELSLLSQTSNLFLPFPVISNEAEKFHTTMFPAVSRVYVPRRTASLASVRLTSDMFPLLKSQISPSSRGPRPMYTHQ